MFRNSRVSSQAYTDLAGNVVVRPSAGELEIGDTAEFMGHTPINIDGSAPDFPVENEVISRAMICAVCGIQVDGKHQLTLQGSHWVCSKCIDEPGRGE